MLNTSPKKNSTETSDWCLPLKFQIRSSASLAWTRECGNKRLPMANGYAHAEKLAVRKTIFFQVSLSSGAKTHELEPELAEGTTPREFYRFLVSYVIDPLVLRSYGYSIAQAFGLTDCGAVILSGIVR